MFIDATPVQEQVKSLPNVLGIHWKFNRQSEVKKKKNRI